MKVSKAMLKGLEQVSGQATETFYNAVNNKACALGCAYIGLGVDKAVLMYSDAPSKDVADQVGSAAEKYVDAYRTTISADNDLYGLTVERIAARLEAIGE